MLTTEASAANLAVHDLKNALGALEAGLERLALDPDPAAARAAHRSCRALRQRFVAYLSLYGGGTLVANCEDESPQALLALVVARQESAVPVSVSDAAGAPPYAFFDHRLVGMALDAALHNATRFARERVDLSMRVDDGHLVFVIDDDGPGVDASIEDAEAASTGLGTALCRAVATAHGCQRGDRGVRLFTRPEGGARFELWLPT